MTAREFEFPVKIKLSEAGLEVSLFIPGLNLTTAIPAPTEPVEAPVEVPVQEPEVLPVIDGPHSLEIVTRQSHLGTDGVWFDLKIDGKPIFETAEDGQTRSATYHDLVPVWKFGASPKIAANLRGDPIEANCPRGWFVPNIFGSAGRHDVSCTLYSRETKKPVAYAETIVTIADPDAVFSGNRTICVSNTGDFSDAPVGALQVRFWEEAVSMLRSKDKTPKRILVKRGEDHRASGIRARSDLSNLYVSAYGKGNNPKIGQFWIADTKGYPVHVENLDFAGGWNPCSETQDGPVVDKALYIDGCNSHVTVTGCTMSGNSIGLYTRNNGENFILAFVDNEIRDWCDFGMLLASRARHGIRSNIIESHPLALGGGLNKGTGHNTHGPTRWSGGKELFSVLYFGQNSLLSNIGWSNFTSRRLGKVPAHQACFRTSSGHPQHWLYLNDNFMEGGAEQIVIAQTAAEGATAAMNTILDGGVCVGSTATGSNIGVVFGATSVFDMLVIQPDVEPMNMVGYQRAVSVNVTQDDELVAVKGNRAIIHTSAKSANRQIVPFDTRAGNVEMADNHAYAPHIGRRDFDLGPVFETPKIVSHQWANAPEPDTSLATPLDTIRRAGQGHPGLS